MKAQYQPTKEEMELEAFENYVDKVYFEREPDWQAYEFQRKEREYIQQLNDAEKRLRNNNYLTIFSQLKEEILKRTNEVGAKRSLYKKINNSETFTELMQVIKDWSNIAVEEKIIDGGLIESYKEQFNDNKIFYNEDVTEGFLLASGYVFLKACGDATVVALDRAVISASDDVIVFPSDRAYIRISGAATVYISDKAKDYAFKENGETKIFTIGNIIVEALGSATCTTYGNAIEVKLTKRSIPKETKELISVLEQAAKKQGLFLSNKTEPQQQYV